MRLTRLSILLLVVTASPANAGSGNAGGQKARPAGTREVICPEAGRARIVLPAGLDGIDGFRVYVADAAPGSATDVTVLSAGRDRTLRAFAPGELTLSMDAPLRGRTIDVALEPVLDAPQAACVARVELLRGGEVVGAAEIR